MGVDEVQHTRSSNPGLSVQDRLTLAQIPDWLRRHMPMSRPETHYTTDVLHIQLTQSSQPMWFLLPAPITREREDFGGDVPAVAHRAFASWPVDSAFSALWSGEAEQDGEGRVLTSWKPASRAAGRGQVKMPLSKPCPQ